MNKRLGFSEYRQQKTIISDKTSSGAAGLSGLRVCDLSRNFCFEQEVAAFPLNLLAS